MITDTPLTINRRELLLRLLHVEADLEYSYRSAIQDGHFAAALEFPETSVMDLVLEVLGISAPPEFRPEEWVSFHQSRFGKLVKERFPEHLSDNDMQGFMAEITKGPEVTP